MSLKANSKSNAKDQQESLLRFDVQWLSGQKNNPDPLPSRHEYEQLNSVGQSPQKKRRVSVNILASFLALGLFCSVAYGLYHLGWIPQVNPSRPFALENPQWTPEEQRQANETIEAILALQEMASQSDANPPTQKR